MTLREFGEKVVHESHMAVCKWEKKGELATNMNSNTEHELRLYIVEKLLSKSKESQSKFYEEYLATKRFFCVNTNQFSMLRVVAA